MDLALHAGRLDAPKIATLLRLSPAVDEAFICGRHAMNDEVERALLQAGLQPQQIHVERFGLPPGEAAAAAVRQPGDASTAVITIVRDGFTREVPYGLRDTSILAAAARAGLDVPYPCKSGVCATCRAKMKQGQVRMDRNFALEMDELAAGYVLTCQSHPTTDRVVISFDERRRGVEGAAGMARPCSAGFDGQRELILSAAAQLFAQRGYGGSTMTEVAAACDISRGTLHHYVCDKQDLLAQIATTHVQRLQHLFRSLSAQHLPPRQQLTELVLRFMQVYEQAQAKHRVLTEDVKFLPDGGMDSPRIGCGRASAKWCRWWPTQWLRCGPNCRLPACTSRRRCCFLAS